jgi:hypothetical protein
MREAPKFTISQIQDIYTRKNFEELRSYFLAQNQLLDFAFFELLFTKAETDFKVAHGLPYIPLDIIVTHLTGTGDVTFKYGAFDATYLILDVSGPCRVRFFAGTCPKILSALQANSSDAQKFISGV